MSADADADTDADANVDADADAGTPAGTQRWKLAVVALTVTWVFAAAPPAEPGPLALEILVGVVFALPVAYFGRAFFPGRTDVDRVARSIPLAARYLGFFVKELLVANVTVARLVLDPRAELDPGVVDVPLRVETPGAITLIANSITLTPGTLSMDYDDDANVVRVHTVDIADPDGIVTTIRIWEDYALRMFDEDASPDDAAPNYVVDPADTLGGDTDE
ncbi:Na+/H+ antiporter subunit E [Halocalculus aciditolerans]|uniref:Na+/H+ antiporter subunit E n=1 Tax=Halocalculus aciditolerans TaxID=1383812 RepID=A0A830FAT4_9EURY|nr:Na+/H+ antiporter subunit E [Halocalculus aciditolerans]GGL56605.1 Na+/H+ antiporter subunit E [Halocalculus aciditolerans]